MFLLVLVSGISKDSGGQELVRFIVSRQYQKTTHTYIHTHIYIYKYIYICSIYIHTYIQ